MVVAFAVLLAPFRSAVDVVTDAVDASTVASAVPGGTSTVSANTETAPAGMAGAVQDTVPDPPSGGVVQLQPGGGVNPAKVVPAGVGCDIDNVWASDGPVFVTVAVNARDVPAATGSGESTSAMVRSAWALAIVLAAELLLLGIGSGEDDPAMTELFSVAPPADGRTPTVTVNTADADGANDGALHEIGPFPPSGGVEHDHPPEGAIDTNVVDAGMPCVNVGIVAALGPALLTVIV